MEENYSANNFFFFINATACLVYLHQERPALQGRSPATTSTVFSPVGAVTAWTIVATVLMKLTVPLESQPPVLPTTLRAITTGVFPKYGCATVTMTAVMDLMNATAVSV